MIDRQIDSVLNVSVTVDRPALISLKKLILDKCISKDISPFNPYLYTVGQYNYSFSYKKLRKALQSYVGTNTLIYFFTKEGAPIWLNFNKLSKDDLLTDLELFEWLQVSIDKSDYQDLKEDHIIITPKFGSQVENTNSFTSKLIDTSLNIPQLSNLCLAR